MSPLALPSFEIRGFRAFEYLKLDRLGRVNLFVGKNNVGKTSLLEALWIYANQGSPSVLWSLLADRDEGGTPTEFRITANEELEDLTSGIRYLFYGRQQPKIGVQKMEFGPSEYPEQHVMVKFTWAENMVDEQGNRRIHEVEEPYSDIDRIPALLIRSGKNNNLIRLDRLFVTRGIREQFTLQMEKPCVFVPANGLSIGDIGKYWDNVTLGPMENDVLGTMKIIEPEIERINLISNQKNPRSERIPIVRISFSDAPMPLRSLGEGMNRMFGIALAMVNAKDGILLVDEIESGLHYSILPDMWSFIFQAARRLNVQVFATTHSWDCITGFQQAAQESDQDGMLIRLENKKGKIIPTFFDEKRLAIVTREQIEVR
jgi:hypothetical protein